MNSLRSLLSRIAALFTKTRADRDLDAEMQSHLALHIEDNLRRGMTPQQARREALIKLGGLEQTKELIRQRRGLPWLENLLQDLRLALRMVRKNPGFASLVVLTLALGIGANTAIFSVVNTVLLAPLKFRDPDRLVMVWGSNLAKGFKESPVSGGDFAEWKAQNTVFEEMAPSWDSLYTLTGAGDPQLLIGYQLSAAYFHVMSVAPQLGRTFSVEEDRPGGPAVVVLSDSLWRRVFRADPAILGKSITLDGQPLTVVGVMPPGHKYPAATELWTPLAMPPSLLTDFKRTPFRILARLKPGVSLAQAQQQMSAIQDRISQQHPDTDSGNGVVLESIREQLSGDIRLPLLVLLGAVGFVLLIGCANVANLLLAQASGRKKEIAVRSALGASKSRLVRQFFTESLLLSLLGGAAGLGLAAVSAPFFVALFPNNIANLNIPKVETIAIDARVLFFTLAVALLTGVLFGIAPVLHFLRGDLANAMKGRGASTGPGERRFRKILVAAEVALSLILLVGAGLLIQSFRNLLKGSLGFDSERVLASELFLSMNRYPQSDPQKWDQFTGSVLEKIHALPGVESAGATNFLPLSGFWSTVTFTVDGQALPESGQEPVADSRIATPDYFRTMGSRMLQGRAFAAQDRKGSPEVAIVNETLARRLWGAQDPIGKRLNIISGKTPASVEVVGVVGDVNSFGLEEKAHGDLYRPFAQTPYPLISFVVRTSGRPASLTTAVQQAIWAVDKDQPLYKTIAMEDLANESLALRRVSTLLLGAFSTLALLLAALGIYGLMAYSVAQRTQEIGIRMALGAPPSGVLRMVVFDGLKTASAGLALGLAGALAASRLIAGMLYGVSSTDPAAFLATVLILTAVAAAACYLPARRAMRVHPITALRYE
jgi:predicted permease